MTYLPFTTGFDSRFEVVSGYLGDGTAGPFTVTHNKNTREVLPFFVKTIGGAPLTTAEQGQEVKADWKRDPTDDKNKIIVRPDEAWGSNEIRYTLICVVGFGDLVAPTAPTIAAGTPTDTTIPVTVSGATDNTAVAGYNFFVGGIYAGSSLSTSFTFTGLTPNTQYSLTAQAFDVAGNTSPSSAAVTPTTTLSKQTFSYAWTGTTKPASIADWSPTQLSPSYVVTSGNAYGGTAPSSNANYWGGGVVTTPMATVLHSSTVTIGDGGSSPRKTGPAVAGADATFTNGVFAGVAGFASGTAVQIYTKVGSTITARTSQNNTAIAGDVLKLTVTFNGTNYVYTLTKNGAAMDQWIDTGNIMTPGRYGGFAVNVEYASGQYGPPGIKGTITIADN